MPNYTELLNIYTRFFLKTYFESILLTSKWKDKYKLIIFISHNFFIDKNTTAELGPLDQ